MKKLFRRAFETFLISLFLSVAGTAGAFESDGPWAQVRLAERDGKIEQRIASTLGKVGKNLILERTRGPKEMALYQKAAPAVVLVLTDQGFGSGAIVDTKGYVLTNWHVVKNEPAVVVVFKPKDGAELKKELAFRATVDKTDQKADLALLKIERPPEKIDSLQLAEPAGVAVGQDVHAIGHPAGESWTYTKGIVSQIRPSYEWRTTDGIVHVAKVIQTQTPVNPGSSGGPLLDDDAKLVGINSFRADGEGLNYAVAVDEIQDFMLREGSRASSLDRSKPEPRCTETYDTMGKGWPNIRGCYVVGASPPPDFWLIFSSATAPAAYAALASRGIGRIDTAILPTDQSWRDLMYFIDVNCDGVVELIGHQNAGSDDITSYQVPGRTVRLRDLVKELDSGLKKGRIPYKKLRVCQ